jgi:hypothetical protein
VSWNFGFRRNLNDGEALEVSGLLGLIGMVVLHNYKTTPGGGIWKHLVLLHASRFKIFFVMRTLLQILIQQASSRN